MKTLPWVRFGTLAILALIPPHNHWLLDVILGACAGFSFAMAIYGDWIAGRRIA